MNRFLLPLYAPMSNLNEKLEYREIHSSLPFTMRIFMTQSRRCAFILIMILSVLSSIIIGKNANLLVVFFAIIHIFQDSRIDIYRIIGFHLFKFLVKQ
jgi:hypothetical protein